MRAAARPAVRIFVAACLLSSGPALLRAQAPGLDSVLVHAVGHATRIWREASRAPLEGRPQFVHDSALTVLLPNDELTTVPLRRIVRISELERATPPNMLYFKFGGVIAGAVAGAIIGHNLDKGSHSDFNHPAYGSAIGAIGGALLGGILGTAIGSLSHPRQHWVTVYRR